MLVLVPLSLAGNNQIIPRTNYGALVYLTSLLEQNQNKQLGQPSLFMVLNHSGPLEAVLINYTYKCLGIYQLSKVLFILSGVTIKTKPEHTHKVQIEVLSNGWKNWVKQVFKRKMTEKDGGAVTGEGYTCVFLCFPQQKRFIDFVDKNWEVMEGITQLVCGVSV